MDSEDTFNWQFLAAASVSLFITFGHFVMGWKMYMAPMLKGVPPKDDGNKKEAVLDDYVKSVLVGVFHFVSVFLVTSCAVYFIVAFDVFPQIDWTSAILFSNVNYAGCALVQIVVGLLSKAKFYRFFQWILFGTVAGFGFSGLRAGKDWVDWEDWK